MTINNNGEEKRIDELFSELEVEVEVDMQDCSIPSNTTTLNHSTRTSSTTQPLVMHPTQDTREQAEHDDQQWQDTQEDLAAVEMSEEDFEREFQEDTSSSQELRQNPQLGDNVHHAVRTAQCQSLKRRGGEEGGGCTSVGETRRSVVVKRRRVGNSMSVVDEPS